MEKIFMEVNFKPITSFKYWYEFSYYANNYVIYDVFDRKDDIRDSKTPICRISSNIFQTDGEDSESILCKEDAEIDKDGILTEFKTLFKHRPEYYVGRPYEKSFSDIQSLITYYELSLLGCILIRNKNYYTEYTDKEDVESIQYGMSIINWIRHDTDFYVAFYTLELYDAYQSGLLVHSIKTCNVAIELSQISAFSSVPIHKIVLLSLIHAFDRIGRISSTNDSGPSYKDPVFPFGYGATSMILASTYIKDLTIEELSALRFCAGIRGCAPSDKYDCQYVEANFPIVKMLQMARDISILNYFNSERT